MFEIRVTAPSGPQNPNKEYGAADPLPMARLVVYDRPTHYILWADTQSIDVALKQKTHDVNFDRALDRLLIDLKSVAIAKSLAGDVRPGEGAVRRGWGVWYRLRGCRARAELRCRLEGTPFMSDTISDYLPTVPVPAAAAADRAARYAP